MNGILIAIALFGADPTQEQLKAYFEEADARKAAYINSGEEKVSRKEFEVNTINDGVNYKKKVLEAKKELEQVRKAEPFLFLSETPKIGDIGKIQRVAIVELGDENSIIGILPKHGATESACIMLFESKSRLKKNPKVYVSPDTVFIVTAVGVSAKSSNEEDLPLLAEVALKLLGNRPYMICKAVKKDVLEEARATYSENPVKK